MEQLRARFLKLWTRTVGPTGGEADAEAAWRALDAGYAAAGRRYHGWGHVAELLAGHDAVRDEPDFAGLEVNLFATYRLPFPTWADNMRCQPFYAARAVNIGADVRLPIQELATLCGMLVASGNSASAQFVNTDELQAALLVEFAHRGMQVRYMIPTIKSASMLRRHACQPLL